MGNVGQPEPCLIATLVASAHFLVRGDLGGQGRQSWLSTPMGSWTDRPVSSLALSIHWAPLIRLCAYAFSYKKLSVSVVVPYSWQGLFALASDIFIAPAILALVGAALASRKGPICFWVSALILVLFLLMPLPWAGYTIQGFLQTHLFAVPLVYFKGLLWTCLAFIAPAGLGAVMRGDRRALLTVITVGILALAGDVILLYSLPLPLPLQSRFPVLAVALLALGLGAIVAAARVKTGTAGALLLAWFIVLPYAFPLSLDHLAWNTMTFQRGGLMAWIRREHPHERTVSPVSRGFVLPPNQGSAYGVRCADLNAVFFLGTYFQLFFTPPAPPTLIAFRDPTSILLRQSGATLALVPADVVPARSAPLAIESGSAALALPEAAGRLFFPWKTARLDRARPVGDQLRELGGGKDGIAVIETMGQETCARWPSTPRGEGRLTFLKDEPETVDVLSEAPSLALLVLRDSWYPGWRATVDGVRVPIYRANGCFRAVVVPEGDHDVRFIYRPWLVYLSGAVSFIAMLLLFGLALAGRRRVGARAELSEGVPLPTFP